MKKAFFILLVAMASFASAQEMNSVMIIPFDPEMYFSDSDDMLAKYNKKTVKEVRTLFRYGLNINLNARVMTTYKTTNLLSDSSSNALNDLALIYKSISYFGDEPIPTAEELSQKESQSKKTGIFQKTLDSKAQNNTKQNDLKMPKKYINVKVQNKELFNYLSEKYGVDLFLFCNQFNLETNYQQCLDRSTNTFQRELMVHYSLFDKNGKQLAGGITQANFPSNSNDIMSIMKTNFPQLSEQMATRLPGSPMIRSVKEN
jgi:hypothetical protein